MDNVIPLRPKNPLFPAALRGRLEESLKSTTDDPKKAVTHLEDALCAYAVSFVKTFVTKLATRASQALAKAANG